MTSYSTSLEHIAIIAVQASSHSRNRTAGHVNDSREQFSGNLVHIRNHKHQTLGGGESGSQKTSRQGSVQSSSSSSLRLVITHVS